MIPPNIKQVVERLIARGLIKRAGWVGANNEANEMPRIGGKNCRLCGRLISKTKQHDCPKMLLY